MHTMLFIKSKYHQFLNEDTAKLLYNCPGPYWVIEEDEIFMHEGYCHKAKIESGEEIGGLNNDIIIEDYKEPEHFKLLIEKYQQNKMVLEGCDKILSAFHEESLKEDIPCIVNKVKAAVTMIQESTLKQLQQDAQAERDAFPQTIYCFHSESEHCTIADRYFMKKANAEEAMQEYLLNQAKIKEREKAKQSPPLIKPLRAPHSIPKEIDKDPLLEFAYPLEEQPKERTFIEAIDLQTINH